MVIEHADMQSIRFWSYHVDCMLVAWKSIAIVPFGYLALMYGRQNVI